MQRAQKWNPYFRRASKEYLHTFIITQSLIFCYRLQKVLLKTTEEADLEKVNAKH